MRIKKTVAIVGLGYVGLPLALLAEEKGYQVIGIDIDKSKVALINQRKSPLKDKRIIEQLKKSKLRSSTDVSKITKAAIVVVCVPTPVNHPFSAKGKYTPNLGPLRAACQSVGKYLSSEQLVIIESTINPGVCDEVVIPVLEVASGLKAGIDFYVAHCPERINPGNSAWSQGYSVANLPRVVGSLEPIGLQKALQFYQSLIDAPIKAMGSLKEAEAVKVVENAFRDLNLAFVNELAKSFSILGIDIEHVLEGAATKPYAFMRHYPGCGVGGHCIPVDPYYLIDYAEKHGFDHQLLKEARKINNSMPEFTVGLLKKELMNSGELSGAQVAVLGLAYKPNVDDTRESPALEIIKLLKYEGMKVRTFDPWVLEKSTHQSLEKVLTGVQAVILATEHEQFKNLKPDFFTSKGIRIVIDGRNSWDKEEFLKAGLAYRGVGR